mgnify:CR=1 FL=1
MVTIVVTRAGFSGIVPVAVLSLKIYSMDKEEAIKAGLYQVIGAEIDDAYMAELKKQIIHPEIIKEMADDIKIVYSPFHGTGNVNAKDNSGVGRKESNTYALIPFAARQRAASSANSGDFLLES